MHTSFSISHRPIDHSLRNQSYKNQSYKNQNYRNQRSPRSFLPRLFLFAYILVAIVACDNDDTAKGEPILTNIMIKSDQGLYVIDPGNNNQATLVDAEVNAQAKTAIAYQTFAGANGSYTKLGRYGVYVKGNHLYKINLDKDQAITPQRLSTISDAAGICAIHSPTVYYGGGEFSPLEIVYPGDDGECYDQNMPDGTVIRYSADNVRVYVTIHMSEVDAPLTSIDSYVTFYPVTRGQEIVFAYSRRNQTDNSLQRIIEGRLVIVDGALVWYAGESVVDPVPLLDSAAYLVRVRTVSDESGWVGVMIQVDNALYVFDTRNVRLSAPIYQIEPSTDSTSQRQVNATAFGYRAANGRFAYRTYIQDRGNVYSIEHAGNFEFDVSRVNKELVDLGTSARLLVPINGDDLFLIRVGPQIYVLERASGVLDDITPSGYQFAYFHDFNLENLLFQNSDSNAVLVTNVYGETLLQMNNTSTIGRFSDLPGYSQSQVVLNSTENGLNHLQTLDLTSLSITSDLGFAQGELSSVYPTLYQNRYAAWASWQYDVVQGAKSTLFIADLDNPGELTAVLPELVGIQVVR